MTCKNPLCSKRPYRHGFCKVCYLICRHYIDNGSTTWSELQRNADQDAKVMAGQNGAMR